MFGRICYSSMTLFVAISNVSIVSVLYRLDTEVKLKVDRMTLS
jgi:hypothetical protein